MNMKILTIGIVIIMVFSGCIVSAKKIKNEIIKKEDIPKNVLFRDDFNEWNTDWHIITEFTSFDLHHGMAQLTIWKAWRFMYSNVEMRAVDQFKYNNLSLRTQINNSWGRFDKFQEPKTGSYGFGFWNHVFNPLEIEYAWFFYSKSPNPFYKKNGLWAVCKAPSDQPYGGFSIVEIKGYKITDWHEYEIIWNEDSVDFIIDKENVAHITKGVPQKECHMHVWQDNAAWYGSDDGNIYYPKFLRLKHHNMAFLDYVEISE